MAEDADRVGGEGTYVGHRVAAENPNIETRNPKQIRRIKSGNDPNRGRSVLNIRSFEF